MIPAEVADVVAIEVELAIEVVVATESARVVRPILETAGVLVSNVRDREHEVMVKAALIDEPDSNHPTV